MKYLVNEKKTISTENWEERMGEISIEEFAKNNGFEIVEGKPDYILKKEEKTKLRNELKEVEDWLTKNDWVPNKILTGEWEETDKRWITYLADRKVYRHRQDEINELLGE